MLSASMRKLTPFMLARATSVPTRNIMSRWATWRHERCDVFSKYYYIKNVPPRKAIRDERIPRSELSDLAHIETKSGDPMDLFREWHEEAKTFSTETPNVFCLATVSRDYRISARHLLLRRLDEDGFAFMTDRRSRKAHDMSEVNSATMCFLWSYRNDRKEHISRQVRIEGVVEKLPKELCQDLYDGEPLYCKVRSHICVQGREIDWNDLKQRHDNIMREVRSGENSLPMPEHIVGYKVVPTMMEFYSARDYLIADRLLFERDQPTSSWGYCHIAA